MILTAAQVRQACALLQWSSLMLVWNAKISHESARKICEGYDTASVPEEQLQAVQGALEAAGIEFGGGGSDVRLRKVES